MTRLPATLSALQFHPHVPRADWAGGVTETQPIIRQVPWPESVLMGRRRAVMENRQNSSHLPAVNTLKMAACCGAFARWIFHQSQRFFVFFVDSRRRSPYFCVSTSCLLLRDDSFITTVNKVLLHHWSDVKCRKMERKRIRAATTEDNRHKQRHLHTDVKPVLLQPPSSRFNVFYLFIYLFIN